MEINKIIGAALQEDCVFDDASAPALDDDSVLKKAVIFSKSDGVVCGVDIASAVFKRLCRNSKIKQFKRDGGIIKTREKIMEITAPIRVLIAGERTALNFLQHLSGIATITHKYVELLAKRNSTAKIYDTRKTIPLLRKIQKHAIRCGGGANHRMNLSDVAMLKDNHLRQIKNLGAAIKKIKAKRNVPVEVECQNIGEVIEAIGSDADIIMLDNMSFQNLKKAVHLIRKKVGRKKEIEVSGGLNLELVDKCCTLDIDRISVGAITHSVPALDISMDINDLRKSNRKVLAGAILERNKE